MLSRKSRLSTGAGFAKIGGGDRAGPSSEERKSVVSAVLLLVDEYPCGAVWRAVKAGKKRFARIRTTGRMGKRAIGWRMRSERINR